MDCFIVHNGYFDNEEKEKITAASPAPVKCFVLIANLLSSSLLKKGFLPFFNSRKEKSAIFTFLTRSET